MDQRQIENAQHLVMEIDEILKSPIEGTGEAWKALRDFLMGVMLVEVHQEVTVAAQVYAPTVFVLQFLNNVTDNHINRHGGDLFQRESLTIQKMSIFIAAALKINKEDDDGTPKN